jgi:hypothetical protein
MQQLEPGRARECPEVAVAREEWQCVAEEGICFFFYNTPRGLS